MRGRVLVLGMVAGALVACREAPELFQPTDRTPVETQPLRMTYSPLDDRAPSWSADGDTLYYVAEGYGALPRTRGVVVAQPAAGGVTGMLLPLAQTAGGLPRWLSSPAASPDGSRVAYVDVAEPWPEGMCEGVLIRLSDLSIVPHDRVPTPLLRSATLRVRALGETGPVSADPSVRVPLPGRARVGSVPELGGIPLWDSRLYPFQREYGRTGALPLRPTWAPDGSRLAFSDGLRIYTWAPGDGAATPLDGTADGVAPAWDPSGEWIAFARMTRTETGTERYYYAGQRGPACAMDATTYAYGAPRIVLVRADGGGERVDLGLGAEPAWSPDGAWLYVQRSDGIWRVSRDGATAEAVAGAGLGRDPAVSPDGGTLAFVRETPDGGLDVWTVAVQP